MESEANATAAWPCPVVTVSLWLGRWIGPGLGARTTAATGPWEGITEPGTVLDSQGDGRDDPALEETLSSASVFPAPLGTLNIICS